MVPLVGVSRPIISRAKRRLAAPGLAHHTDRLARP